MTKTFYITTPIYYVNDVPHIGHAYCSTACDVLARFKRLDGFDVMFLTGTDEHGQKIEKTAIAAGVSPQDFTDKVSQNFRDMSGLLNLTNDDFIRTTEERHKKSSQEIWNRLFERGEIYLGKYEGWYAIRDEAYYGENELTDGPDGKKIAPSGAECEWVEEPSYFFRLSAWGDKLLDFYDKNPEFILPLTRRNEVKSFIKQGLHDLSVSRSALKWGVPVPNDPDHVMYVWLDALTIYITALGFPDQDSEKYKKYWPADVHVVGKDILRFHALYWPAFLMAADLKPPKRIFAHGWWTNEGEKISKSLGNVIDPVELVAQFGVDQIRYFVMREVPFGNDCDYSHQSMIRRINGDLANDLGNLAQRSLSMIQKNCNAAVPQPGSFTAGDQAHLDKVYGVLDDVRAQMDVQAFSKALDVLWGIIGDSNRYVDEQAPWAIKKTDPIRMGTVLYVLAETVRVLAILIQPFMPDSMGKMLDQLAVPDDKRDFTAVSKDSALKAGVALPAPQGIFPRYVEEEK